MLFQTRRTPLAFLNLLANPTRAIVSIAGVTFALLLVFVQLGFRGAVANTATIVYGKLKFDVVVQSREYLHLYEPRRIDRNWIDILKAHPDIENIEPFWIMLNRWQSPSDGRFRAIGMMAVAPDSEVIELPEVIEKLKRLSGPNDVLIDRATRPDYGPSVGRKFGDDDIGLSTELGGKTVTIREHFLMGTGLATNGAVLINDVGFGMRSGTDVRRTTSMGLIQLREGVDPELAAKSIREWLLKRDPRSQDSIRVLSRKEVIAKEHHRWLNETPIGIIFQMGVVLAFMVGAAVVYLVLAQDVANRLPEFATLKAMGYPTRFIAGVVLSQAWWLAVAGYIPAALLAELLYRVTALLAGIPIGMTGQRLIGVAILSFGMCTLSGLGAVRKIWQAEPASLF